MAQYEFVYLIKFYKEREREKLLKQSKLTCNILFAAINQSSHEINPGSGLEQRIVAAYHNIALCIQ